MEQKIDEKKKWAITTIKWVILFVGILGFLSIARNVWNNEIMSADIVGYKVVSNLLISDFMTPIIKIITNFCSAVALLTISLLSILLIRNKKIGISVTLNLFIATALNLILKNILQRPRPTEYRLIEETGYSFPSGHSMVSMAFYGFFMYLIYKYVKNTKLKWSSIVLLALLIFTIGVSRIYLGVHYTSDVIGGFLISISYLVIYTRIIKKFVLGRDVEMSIDNYNDCDDNKNNKKEDNNENITDSSVDNSVDKNNATINDNIKEKTKNLINSFKYAFEGFFTSLKTERNMKIHIFIMFLVIAMGIIFKITPLEWIICTFCFSMVIAGELINTAIETTVDLAMPHKNEKAKIAKDVSACAVLILAIGSAIIGLIIFVPKIL